MNLKPYEFYAAQMSRVDQVLNQSGPEGPGSPQPFDMALVSSIRAQYATARLQLMLSLEIREIMLVQAKAAGLLVELGPPPPINDAGPEDDAA